ncbi:MAG: polyribonucleotide nucleotidyltransferase, partial [Cyclobacteriaceae bacterium]|nr:polyribonucleotide nucleotidyltransferase [Cyclobacteriaceae bacterium]
ISEVRVARIDGKYIINPTLEQKEKADLDFIVAASIENILMVEGECKEINEEDMLVALKLAHEAIKVQCELQIELTKATNKTVKRIYNHEVKDEAFKAELHSLLYDKVYAVARQQLSNKHQRSELFSKIVEDYVASLPADTTVNKDLVKKYYKDIQKKACRDLVLNEKVRLDGRKTNEIRPIWSEVDYLPMAHGSAVFTRGETQSLSTVTLGTKLDEQMIDGAMFSGSNKFILHYNFPSFSTGEVKPNRGPGRREVGHGNLAMRALKQVLPNMTESPYTIRLVSDILESNGSSSMATVCAGSLALMDAGIKISGPVSGIAMGMISDSTTKKYAILSDILGDEDHLGDMDFKVTGTEKGITACQMDLKVDGLTYEVLKEALDQAKEGRAHILNEMKKTLAASKPDLKPHTPRAVTIVIDKELIGAVIGPGGKVVQDIQKTTGATVVIEEVGNKGIVNIFANNQEVMDAAVRRVKAIVAVPEVGEVYSGIVKSIMPFGAFVEFMPGKDGLLHISEIKWERLETMDGIMQVGEEVKVKLVEVDKKTGKFRLSRKVLLAKPVAKEETPSA